MLETIRFKSGVSAGHCGRELTMSIAKYWLSWNGRTHHLMMHAQVRGVIQRSQIKFKLKFKCLLVLVHARDVNSTVDFSCNVMAAYRCRLPSTGILGYGLSPLELRNYPSEEHQLATFAELRGTLREW